MADVQVPAARLRFVITLVAAGREDTAPVVAAIVDTIGLCLRLVAPTPDFKEEIGFTARVFGLFKFALGPVLVKVFVPLVALDAGGTVVVAAETDARVRLVVFKSAADEGAKEGRLIATGLGMGTIFGVAVAPCIFVVFVAARAFNDILL